MKENGQVWIVREKHPDHFCEAYIVRGEVPQRGYYGPKGPGNRPQWFFWRTRNLANKIRLPRGIVIALGIQPGESFLLVNTTDIDPRWKRK